VETGTTRYLCEPKRASEMTDEVVLLKAKAAVLWCQHATMVSEKPWSYVLIPHDAIDQAATFKTLAERYMIAGRS
jgi:type III restriction enzyme